MTAQTTTTYLKYSEDTAVLALHWCEHNHYPSQCYKSKGKNSLLTSSLNPHLQTSCGNMSFKYLGVTLDILKYILIHQCIHCHNMFSLLYRFAGFTSQHSKLEAFFAFLISQF